MYVSTHTEYLHESLVYLLKHLVLKKYYFNQTFSLESDVVQSVELKRTHLVILVNLYVISLIWMFLGELKKSKKGKVIAILSYCEKGRLDILCTYVYSCVVFVFFNDSVEWINSYTSFQWRISGGGDWYTFEFKFTPFKNKVGNHYNNHNKKKKNRFLSCRCIDLVKICNDTFFNWYIL